MEDTDIKPGHYAYQLRVDIPNDSGLTSMMEFISKYDVKHYIVGAEKSDSGKEHFQSIMWFTHKQNITKLRNWWKDRADNTKQPISITSAKKIRNLGKYTMKDNNFITNLSKEEIQLIGKWKPKVKHNEWSRLLDEHSKKFDLSNVNMFTKPTDYNTYAYNAEAPLVAFITYMLDFYKVSQKRPSRATLQYLAWKHGHMSNSTLIQKWF